MGQSCAIDPYKLRELLLSKPRLLSGSDEVLQQYDRLLCAILALLWPTLLRLVNMDLLNMSTIHSIIRVRCGI